MKRAIQLVAVTSVTKVIKWSLFCGELFRKVSNWKSKVGRDFPNIGISQTIELSTVIFFLFSWFWKTVQMFSWVGFEKQFKYVTLALYITKVTTNSRRTNFHSSSFTIAISLLTKPEKNWVDWIDRRDITPTFVLLEEKPSTAVLTVDRDAPCSWRKWFELTWHTLAHDRS